MSSTSNTWTIPIIIAVIGVVAYFIFQDWFNQYLVNAKPKFLNANPKAKPGVAT